MGSKLSGFAGGALVALVLVLLLGSVFAVGAMAGEEPPPPKGDKAGIVVTGSGSASAVPDEARFTVGVRRKEASVGAAMDAMTGDVRKVRQALRKAGVAGKDIQTESMNVDASYDYSDNEQRIDGYVATQSLSVKARDIKTVGDLMSAAAGAGGDSVSISGFGLAIGDKKALLAEARAEAVKDARRSAAQFAEAAGRELGTVVFVQDDTKESNRVFRDGLDFSRTPMDAAALKAIPINAGEQKVTVKVSVRWALK